MIYHKKNNLEYTKGLFSVLEQKILSLSVIESEKYTSP